jgi:hypothetical protein
MAAKLIELSNATSKQDFRGMTGISRNGAVRNYVNNVQKLVTYIAYFMYIMAIRLLNGMARLDYPANLGRLTHLKLAWKLSQELRHQPGRCWCSAGCQPAAQWSAFSAVTHDEASSNNALHKSKIY